MLNTLSAPQAPPANGDPHLHASEIDHRIANNLTMISGLVRLRANALANKATISGETAADFLRDAAHQIESVARLHRLLSGHRAEAVLNICDFLRDICGALHETIAVGARFRQSYAAECLLRREKALPVALIVSEAITNAAKYSHPSGVQGDIRVDCTLIEGRLVIAVSDDGVGLPEGFNPAVDGGLGLRVIRGLAHQLGASWSLTSHDLGSRFELSVPIA